MLAEDLDTHTKTALQQLSEIAQQKDDLRAAFQACVTILEITLGPLQDTPTYDDDDDDDED